MLSVLLPFVLTFTSLTGWKLLNSKAGSVRPRLLTYFFLIYCVFHFAFSASTTA